MSRQFKLVVWLKSFGADHDGVVGVVESSLVFRPLSREARPLSRQECRCTSSCYTPCGRGLRGLFFPVVDGAVLMLNHLWQMFTRSVFLPVLLDVCCSHITPSAAVSYEVCFSPLPPRWVQSPRYTPYCRKLRGLFFLPTLLDGCGIGLLF